MTGKPAIAYDGGALERLDPETLRTLVDKGVVTQGKSASIQFSGLVIGPGGKATCFLPHGLRPDAEMSELDVATLTVKTIAKYAFETPSRTGEEKTDGKFTRLLALIYSLVGDFRRNGLHVERRRTRAKEEGHPNWLRSLERSETMVAPNGALVFADIHTDRTSHDHDTVLGRIQAAVMQEILEEHGWWAGTVIGRKSEIRKARKPRSARRLWGVQLKREQRRLYSIRAMHLSAMLGQYLDMCSDERPGSVLFGLTDFSTVWEHMLRSTLSHVASGWNTRLPKPGYSNESGVQILPRGMLTDIILERDSGLTILDAKYYKADSIKTVPSWPDIAKQYFYGFAVKSLVPAGTHLTNAFAFPSVAKSMRLDRSGKPVSVFDNVMMYRADNTVMPGEFGEIICYYLDIQAVMELYMNRKKVEMEEICI